MKGNVIITVPKLSAIGGVSSFWNGLLPELVRFENLGIKTVEIGGHGKNVLRPLIDQWNLNKVLKRDIDLAVLNPSLGYRSFFRDGLFAKQLIKKKVKFVVFFHGWDAGFESKVEQKYIKFFRASFGQASKIFVLSSAFKRKLVEWGYSGEVIVETTNVDATLLEGFSFHKKLENANTSGKVKLLFLSRLIKDKGIFETIEAFDKLRIKFPDLELTIAGDGSEFNAVEKLVNGKANIVMTGHVAGKEKIELLKNSHIYCLPSYSEGLPTSVLEAMAFGLPVVTTAVGGLTDFFQDGKMGYFTIPRNAQHVAEKLEAMLSDNEVLVRMANYNYNFAKEHLTSKIVAKRLYGHFEEVMAGLPADRHLN